VTVTEKKIEAEAGEVAGLGGTKRVNVRMGDADLAGMAELRARWGLRDDSAVLRVAVRRAVTGERGDGEARRTSGTEGDTGRRRTAARV